MAIDTAVKLLKKRRTKLIATLGPATSEAATIERLIQYGVNIFRLNMSHGNHDEHRTRYHRIREAARQMGEPIAVLADLSGPKIRVGQFPGGPIILQEGDRVTVTTRNVPGKPGLIPSQYEGLANDVQAGDRILLYDGTMELRAQNVQGTEIICTVVQGGKLSQRKGINLPGIEVSTPSLTDKDRNDAQFAMQLGIDFIALSFVRRAADLEDLKALMPTTDEGPAIVAKIERPEALIDSTAIIEAADAIMVARGDLGVELPPEQVPVAQQQLIDHARARNKPVIVATQMLDSMTRNSRPTRAEVADVSYTVSSGADAIMLSAETAIGAHPLTTVEMMDRIARQAEGYLWRHSAFETLTHDNQTAGPKPFGDAVANATALLSRQLWVRAIVVISETGRSTATISAARPAAPIISVSANAQTCRRVNLLWGVMPVQVDEIELENPIALTRRLTTSLGLTNSEDRVLMIRGFHSDPEKNTPSITILSI
ncbi:MAG: pyruvate kinase [Gammaproteobacteria bacterium]|nr:pyruvate kinase [Gammaproteobacteria bacterium]